MACKFRDIPQNFLPERLGAESSETLQQSVKTILPEEGILLTAGFEDSVGNEYEIVTGGKGDFLFDELGLVGQADGGCNAGEMLNGCASEDKRRKMAGIENSCGSGASLK